jgi:hypothetical protein
MALPKSYLTSSKNLKPIFEAIQAAQAPDKFTLGFLETLDFKSSSDRLIIGVLKSLGFLDGDGKPTDRYFRFLDQTQSGAVLAEGIRDAYSDLFQVNKNAQKLSRSDLINKMKTLSQGQLSESVLEKLAMTFFELSKLADFSVLDATAPPVPDEEDRVKDEGREREPSSGLELKNTQLGGLHYNVQIILPETRDTKVYDALFRSLREHLI